MSKKLERVTTADTPAGAGTRDAVESSIDVLKGDKFTSWEEAARGSLGRINRWEDTKNRPVKPEQLSP
jgi:hypothetical protein